jgi:hypothetical protein
MTERSFKLQTPGPHCPGEKLRKRSYLGFSNFPWRNADGIHVYDGSLPLKLWKLLGRLPNLRHLTINLPINYAPLLWKALNLFPITLPNITSANLGKEYDFIIGSCPNLEVARLIHSPFNGFQKHLQDRAGGDTPAGLKYLASKNNWDFGFDIARLECMCNLLTVTKLDLHTDHRTAFPTYLSNLVGLELLSMNWNEGVEVNWKSLSIREH